MSKNFNHKTNDNHLFNFLLVLAIAVIFPQAIPISLIVVFALYQLKIDGKNILLISLLSLLTVIIFLNQLFTNFINEMQKVGSIALYNLTSGDFISMFLTNKYYSLPSYLFILILSITIAGYFVFLIQKNEKYKIIGATNLDQKLDQIQKKRKQEPQLKDGVLLGISKEDKKKIYCADDAKHVLIGGTTGAGKTVAISNFIDRAIKKNFPLLLVDGKGDMGEGSFYQITKLLCKKYGKELFVIDMNIPDQSSKYNPFKNANETVIKDMLINMSNWSEEHYKLNSERYIQKLVKLLLLSGKPLSLKLVIDSIPSDAFKLLSAQLQKANIISKEEHIQNIEIAKASGKIAENASARFATILDSQIGQIFDEKGIDIFTALKQGAVILFILNPLLYPETSQALGRLALIDAKQAVSHLFQSKGNIRKFFIFDEMNVYASSVLLDLINKSRSAKVTCICATQSLADLDSVSDHFRQQVIENCNNFIILRQNSFESAEQWSKIIGTHETIKMTFQLSQDEENSGNGSARDVREFIIHPDEIKSFPTGQGVFLSRDTNEVQKIKVNKPF